MAFQMEVLTWCIWDSGRPHLVQSRWCCHSIGPPGSGRSWTSALGRVLTVVERLLCDSRYGKLRAGKLPFIRDGARFALRVAGLGLSRLGKGRRTGTAHAYRCPKTCPHVFLYVLELGWSRGGKLANLEPDAIHTWPDVAYDG